MIDQKGSKIMDQKASSIKEYLLKNYSIRKPLHSCESFPQVIERSLPP